MGRSIRDFVLYVSRARCHAVKGVDNVQAVRLYKSSPNGWTFQVRGPEGIGPGGCREGKAFMIAGADCTIENLRAIRDAINVELAHEEPIAAQGIDLTSCGDCGCVASHAPNCPGAL